VTQLAVNIKRVVEHNNDIRLCTKAGE